MRKNIKLLMLLCIFVLFSGFGCKCVPTEVQKKMDSVTLEYWRVWDGPDTFTPIIDKYKAMHPFVNINYRLIRYEEYEQKLLEAFAGDRSPDIFSIHNTWTRKYKNNNWISPMPSQVSMVYPVVTGSIKKEIIPEQRTKNTPSLSFIKEYYVDTVYGDVVIKSTDAKTGESKDLVYGFPIALDTLIMFVNRDLFNNAGITNIPKYWDKEFQQTVRKLTKQDNKGQIIQAGAALGGGHNIERSSDILSVLMMQNGTEMMNLEGNQVTIHKTPKELSNEAKLPGLDALRFFTDFANPSKEVYTWNNTMENSLDLFIRGKVAIMFGYSYMIPQIKAGNPKMNLVVSKLPQIEGNNPVNFANYWVETVSQKSRYKNEAWDFILFATEAEQALTYLETTGKVTAIRSLVDMQKEDLEIGAYADQALTAKSWYKGNNANTAEQIMRDQIDAVIGGKIILGEAVEDLSNKLQQTIKPSF
jgi:ABC-type glycerol-3-phosphate transport system substrate-binding protein